MVNITLKNLLLNLLFLWSNFVYSQQVKCNINLLDSCNGITEFNGIKYNEEFICSYWNSGTNTVCIPTSLLTCIENNECSEEFKCINNKCQYTSHENVILKKRFDPTDNILVLLGACIIIPLIFLLFIFILVTWAKKSVEKSELKHAQNTNASSLSSLNLSSKNLLYSRSTNNGSSNRSGNHHENPMEYIPANNLSIINYDDSIGNINTMNLTNNGGNINPRESVNNMVDFNTKLLMAKNYRMQGTGSLSRTPNMTSPKLHVSSPYTNEIKESPLNSPTHQFKLDQAEEVTTAVSEAPTKEENINYYPSDLYSSHTHALPSIPSTTTSPKSNVHELPSIPTMNSSHHQEEQPNYNVQLQSSSPKYIYDKSYNDIKKKTEQRISVSPPLRDWNESYYMVSGSKEGVNMDKSFKSKYEPNRKTKDSLGSDKFNSLPKPSYSSSAYRSNLEKMNYSNNNNYIMALGPTTQRLNENEKVYSDNEDLTMKNMNFSTSSSPTYMPEKSMYNIQYNYPKKFRE